MKASASALLALVAATGLAVAACSSSSSGPAGDAASAPGAAGTSGAPATPYGGQAAASGPSVTYGKTYEGGEFHLGPVDWDESQFHNACAPTTGYAAGVRAVEGELLAGLWNGLPDVSSACDACVRVTTAKGKSALLRVVTFGDTSTNSIDVSPQAYKLLDSGESPRTMTWQFAKCDDTGAIHYEFQTASSEWWTSLWVRNARAPLAKVEVKSANHASFVELTRGSDGTLTDDSGFGKGAITIRMTSIDGTQLTETIPWPSAGIGGQTLIGTSNFP